MNPVTVAEVRAHIAFLRAVHVSSSRGEGSLLADGTRLRAAVRAYIPWLAFHAARASNGRAVLVERAPPLDALPLCRAFYQRVRALPSLQAYFQSDKYAMGCNASMAHWK